MSGPSVHIVDNSNGSNDQVAVIVNGDTIYRGPTLDGDSLKEIMEACMGYDRLNYHATDNKGIQDPHKVVYGDDD